MTSIRARSAVFAIAVLLGCLPVTARSETGTFAIKVLSNRADLVSNDDALTQIVVPDGFDASSLTITVNGSNSTAAFATRADGRYLGRLEGLALGANTVRAEAPDGRGAELVITNHPVEGPVFSGPHISPWICTTASNGLGAPDAKCNANTRIDFFYQRVGSSSFAAYDPENPPNDVEMITTDHGKTVPYIIRQETGTQDRGIYRLAVLFDPTKPWEPWAPQEGWNHKLYYPFGASCGTVYSQSSAQNVQNDNALSRGFMVATSSLNVLGNNCNTVLSAEAVMMLKEHIVDRYGEIRYTFGNGSSGGSIGQHMVANAYPGLLQGLTVGLAFADTLTTGAEVFDCHVLINYFLRSPHLWANVAQQTAVTGHGSSVGTCAGWEALFSAVEDPKNGCGVPAAEHYHPQNNPTGCRGSYQDFERNVWGPRPPELWTPPEHAAGFGFAKGIYDNVGVQYGLKALRQGLITTEQFVDMNEKVGGFDIDFNLTATRTQGDPGTPGIAYRSGRVNDGEFLDQVAIIDSRGTGNVDPLTIHTMHHSFALKDRILKAHGTAANHVVWRGGEPAGGMFNAMDRWLTAVEDDTTADSLAEKIIRNKPEQAIDQCFAGGRAITDKGQCDAIWPYYGAPRIVAGSPTTHDVVKCQLKSLDRSDPEYGPIPFTDLQWTRLQAAFPTGVCDWSMPSAELSPTVPWQTYANGPGGQALGAPPDSTAF